MRAAPSAVGCAVLLETCVKPPSLRPDWVCCGCDGIELTALCLTAGFDSRFELPSEDEDRGPGPLKLADEGAGVVAVALNGST
jgi:hypothetical protein